MVVIGAIIGTGICVLTVEAAAGKEHALGAGPALTVSFVITGLTCLFLALCYAEFASMIPVPVAPIPTHTIPLESLSHG